MQLDVDQDCSGECAHTLVNDVEELLHLQDRSLVLCCRQHALAHEHAERSNAVKEFDKVFTAANFYQLMFLHQEHKILIVEGFLIDVEERLCDGGLLLLGDEPEGRISSQLDLILTDQMQFLLGIKAVESAHGREDKTSIEAPHQLEHVLDDFGAAHVIFV